MADTWYYGSEGKAVGPYSFQELQMMAASGKISAEDHVCGDGQTWQTAGVVDGLQFGQAASPLGYQGTRANVSQAVVNLFGETSLWVRIMAVVIAISSGLMVLAGGGMVVLGMVAPAKPGGPPMALMGLLYFVLAIFYIIPCILLWRYATFSKSFSKLGLENMLENAVRAQKSFWKYCAIFMLVIIALYIVVIIGVVIFAIVLHH